MHATFHRALAMLASVSLIASVVPASASAPAAAGTVIIVDGSVPESDFFAAHALPGARVFTLDASGDGLSQIGDILAGLSGITSLHVVSHGDAGRVLLGNGWIDAATLEERADEVGSWEKHLASGAQIDLYGCDIAADERGEAFIRALADLTESRVWASDDTTGATGDWELERATGRGRAALAFDDGLGSYAYDLNHFRYGTMSYSLVSGRTVLIKIENDWTNNHGFIPTSTAIGGVVTNAFTLNFGDGQTTSVTLRVTSRDATNNDVLTEAVTQSGATYVSGIRHTYASDGNYTAYWSGGSRESASSQTNGNWRSEMTVNVGNGNSSPVVAVPAVVQVQDDTIFEYALVAVDPNGDDVRFRLGTQQEFYGNGSNSSTTPPTGLTLSSTGAIRWDVRNSALSTSAGARWQMTAMIEDLSSTGAVKSKVPVDFVFVISNNAPPRFVTYPTGTQSAPKNELKQVTLTATDPNWQTGYASPSIIALNPPSTDPAVWTGALVKSSSGASYTTSFTPTTDMAGQTFVVIFRVTNSSGATAVQPVSFLVPGANQAPSNITLSNDEIVEKSPAGTAIGTLSASDIDPGDTHTFTLTGATNTGIFRIANDDELQIVDRALALSGSYTVTVRATDSGSLFLDKSFTVTLLQDDDEDGIADREDSLIGVSSYVTVTGAPAFVVKVSDNTASGTYTGVRRTAFYDGDKELVSFVPNYNSGTIHLANILVKADTHSLVVNMGSELPSGTTKTLYLDDDDFVSLCVKDAAITSVSEISSGCDEPDEIDFESCIGSEDPVTISGITCTDEGSRFKVENLVHSGIVGTPAPSGGTTASASTSASRGNGGVRAATLLARINASLAPKGRSDGDGNASPACASTPFTDVPNGAWFVEHVCVLHEGGIVSGYRDDAGAELGVFRPGNDVNYAEIAKMALLAAGLPANEHGSPKNASARNDWSAPFVRAMEGLRIAIYTEQLDVHGAATRGDVASILLQTFELPLDADTTETFSDLPAKHPRAKALLTAVSLGIMQGDTAADGSLLHTIRPDEPINRAETSKILHLLLEYVASR